MSKKWTPNKFRHLDRNWDNEFRDQQERKLNSDHSGWSPPITSPNANLPPIGNEYAVGLEASNCISDSLDKAEVPRKESG